MTPYNKEWWLEGGWKISTLWEKRIVKFSVTGKGSRDQKPATTKQIPFTNQSCRMYKLDNLKKKKDKTII